MELEFICYRSFPDPKTMQSFLDLHQTIFGDAEGLVEKMKAKPNLLIHVAKADDKVIGYKMGYDLTPTKFYSWLGGVNPDFRQLGVATQLMNEQHRLLKEAGKTHVQTKTMNKWRGMLILTIKMGFDVVGTVTNDSGVTKIILEKEL